MWGEFGVKGCENSIHGTVENKFCEAKIQYVRVFSQMAKPCKRQSPLLVRMRSPVQIWIAAPSLKSLEGIGLRGFLLSARLPGRL